MRKIAMIALSVVLLAAGVAGASQPQADARAVTEELLAVNNVQQNVERMFKQIKDIQLNQLQSLGIAADKKDGVDSLQERLFAVLEAEMSWESMKEEYIDIYTQVFTLEELQALLDFSQSEVGRRINDKMPLLMEKSMVIGQQRAQKAMPKMQEILEDYFKQK